MSITKKRSCIDPGHELLSTQRQCELIDLPRSSYYRQRFLSREADKNLALMRLIDEEYTKHPFYGTRKMRDYPELQSIKTCWGVVKNHVTKNCGFTVKNLIKQLDNGFSKVSAKTCAGILTKVRKIEDEFRETDIEIDKKA